MPILEDPILFEDHEPAGTETRVLETVPRAQKAAKTRGFRHSGLLNVGVHVRPPKVAQHCGADPPIALQGLAIAYRLLCFMCCMTPQICHIPAEPGVEGGMGYRSSSFPLEGIAAIWGGRSYSIANRNLLKQQALANINPPSRTSPEKCTFLSLAFYNTPNLHTVDHCMNFMPATLYWRFTL